MMHRPTLFDEFPRQFWVLFGGSLVNAIGGGMVFPFLTLYLHQHLNLSMTFVGLMLTVWSVSSLLGQLAGGALTDRLGRKKLMVLSLGCSVVLLPLFGIADTTLTAGTVASLLGFTGAMYQPAGDAMVADLVGTGKRPQAYALIRVVRNLGIAIGPAIGGFLAARSYMFVFSLSAAASLVFFLITVLMIRETKPAVLVVAGERQTEGGFGDIWRNAPFVTFAIATALVIVASVQLMTVLPVYMKDQYGLGESFFGWIMSTNAGMVVLLQFPITRATERLPRMALIASGAIIYAVGVMTVALGDSFPHFVASMAVATIGEMIVVPTSTAITADLAPANMRGRYMSVLGLTWSLGLGVGPFLGGLVSDQIAPRALWPIMGSAALVGAAIYISLARLIKTGQPNPAPGSAE